MISRKSALHIMRIGLGITFLWIGILIVKNPEAWSGYLQPWATKLIPVSLTQAIFATGIFDIAIGILLLINILTGIAALLGSLHLLVVLITAGINAITVRDIGLLGAALTLSITSWRRK